MHKVRVSIPNTVP